MSYTREQRAANAAKAAAEAAKVVQAEQPAPVPQTAVEQPPANDAPPRHIERKKSVQDQIRDEISERHERRNTAPTTEPTPEPAKPAAEAKPEEKPAAEPVAHPQVAAVEPAAEPAAAPAPKLVKVKIDGVETEAPEEEVNATGGVHAYQMTKAAENRLAKANQAVAESKQMMAALAQWIQQNAKPQPEQPQISNDQFIQSKIDAIRMGTPEEGATALNDILNRMVPKVDQGAVTHQAIVQISRQNAASQFKREFQDIVSNPMLYKLASTLENERLSQIPQQAWNHPSFAQFDWGDFFRKIGNEVRGAFPRPSQPQTPLAPTTGTPSQASEKEARKASIVALPTAASARAETPPEPKPETREEILNAMRKKRGLPVG